MAAVRMTMSLAARRVCAARASMVCRAVAAVAQAPSTSRAQCFAPLALQARSFQSSSFKADAAAGITGEKPVFLDKHEVEERVLNVVKNFEKIDGSKVTSKANFKDDLGLDSLDAVEVVMAIEDEVSTIFIHVSPYLCDGMHLGKSHPELALNCSGPWRAVRRDHVLLTNRLSARTSCSSGANAGQCMLDG
eukprot:14251-Heterococcus_DN1.PRE.3